MSQMSVEDDRLQDGLAVAGAGDTTLSQDADALLAEMEGSQQPAEQIPQIPLPAEQIPPAGIEGATYDETGLNDSSNGPSSGDEDDDDKGDPSELAELMQKGGLLMSGIPQSQDSQVTDDGEDYMEEKVRKEFATIKTSTWMQKKIDGLTGTSRCVPSVPSVPPPSPPPLTTTRLSRMYAGELGKLVKEHEKSKKELGKPVKEMITENPEMESSLTLLTGLLSDACTNGDLRAMFIDSAKALSSQEKIVEKVQTLMQTIEIGKMILEEKKTEEAAKRGESSSTMSAAAALLGGSSSKKQRKK